MMSPDVIFIENNEINSFPVIRQVFSYGFVAIKCLGAKRLAGHAITVFLLAKPRVTGARLQWTGRDNGLIGSAVALLG